MRRPLTASILATVLVAIVGLQHAAMGFCLCTEDFFLGGCDCEQITAAPACGCDAECPDLPCGDCEVSVTLEVDDFLWSVAPFAPKEQDPIDLDLPGTPFADLTRGTPLASVAMPIRGSPPGPRPLHLRSTVLRL